MRRLSIWILLIPLAFACEEGPAPTHLPEPTPAPPVTPAMPTCAPGAKIDPGPTLPRRLTRLEYDNTIRDLFGFDPRIAIAEFPAEEESLGFDNNARALQVSPLHAELFLTAAEAIAAEAVTDLDALLPCPPGMLADDCADAFIEGFGKRAWRRPLTVAEQARLKGLYAVGEALEGDPLHEGLQLVIEALLQSPNFLYRIEVGRPSAERPDLLALGPYEIAQRLSYLIWRSMPDEELLAAADADALDTVEAVAAQAERMLDDPRAREATWSFFAQWLRLDEVESLDRDPQWYPDFTPETRDLLLEESRLLIEDIVWVKRDLRGIYNASYSFMNKALADHYGIEGPKTAQFERVELDPTRRSGMLTTGAVMAVTAKPNMTSPIHRGIYVRKQVFCTALAPPPPNIVVVAPDPDPNSTTRERFAEHASNPLCASCHKLTDPIGFGFEHYDAVGRWRETENGFAIDPSGEVFATVDADGPFYGAPELSKRLAQSEQVQRCIATQVFRHSFGRGEGPTDDCTLSTAYDGLVESGFDYTALLTALIRSDAFRFRRKDPEVAP